MAAAQAVLLPFSLLLEYPGRRLQAVTSAPGRKLSAMVTLVKDKGVEVMADRGLGPGQRCIRSGATKIGRRQAADRVAPNGARSFQAVDQSRGRLVQGRLLARRRRGAMSVQKGRKVVREVLDVEEMKEVGVCQQNVPQDPCGMVLVRGSLTKKLFWRQVADLQEGLLSNDSE